MASRRAAGWLALLRTPLGLSAAALLVALSTVTVLAPLLWGSEADNGDVSEALEGASWSHWAGTDDLGRDVLLRVLVATRLSVLLALGSTAIGVTTGLVLGLSAVLLGRRVGRTVSTLLGVATAFPGLLVALSFIAIVGTGAVGAMVAIGLAQAPWFGRLTKNLVASVAGRDYVAAARIAGVGRIRVVTRHILPNVAEPLVVNATIGIGASLLAFAGLSFLGLGVQAPSYDWGRLLKDGLNAIYQRPGAALAPAVAVVVAGLTFNLAGEAVAGVLRGQATSRSRRRPRTPPMVPAVGPEPGTVLRVEDLAVHQPGGRGPDVRTVREVSLTVGAGQLVGVVGESGSGKTQMAMAISELIEAPGQVSAVRLELAGRSLLDRSGTERRRWLGRTLAVVFQDPGASFNPIMSVGSQLSEAGRFNGGLARREAAQRAVERLDEVGISDPSRRARQHPHELSGGMLQRAMIGMGMMNTPQLVVADEPTSALDVTIQRQVLDLIRSAVTDRGAALLLISHDIAMVSDVCDRVLVMYGGRLVEELPSGDIAGEARHPYTQALLAATPDMRADRDRPLAVIPGRPVSPADVPEGCGFAARCARADDRCRTLLPPLTETGSGGRVACWHAAPDGRAAVHVPVSAQPREEVDRA